MRSLFISFLCLFFALNSGQIFAQKSDKKKTKNTRLVHAKSMLDSLKKMRSKSQSKLVSKRKSGKQAKIEGENETNDKVENPVKDENKIAKQKPDKGRKRAKDNAKTVAKNSKDDKKKKGEATSNKKISFTSAIQTTNKLLQVRGSNHYNAIGRKNKKDSHTIEGDLDEKGNSSENRIFDVGRKFSSHKSTISRVYSPFKGNKLAKKGMSLFLEAGFGAGGSLDKFKDRVSAQKPTLSLAQFSKGFIPLRLGVGLYTNKRTLSFALDYTYNYSFGSQTFRSENLENQTSNFYSITGFTESPVTDIHELTVNANYYFYQKLTEGVDLLKLYLGLEVGGVFANVASKYSVRNGNKYRVDGGFAFTDFKKKYSTITYLKGGAKLGILLRVSHKIHLLTDVTFNYYYPLQSRVKYQLTTNKIKDPKQAAELLDSRLPLQSDRDILGQKNWVNTILPSMQLNWQLGIRYILPH